MGTSALCITCSTNVGSIEAEIVDACVRAREFVGSCAAAAIGTRPDKSRATNAFVQSCSFLLYLAHGVGRDARKKSVKASNNGKSQSCVAKFGTAATRYQDRMHGAGPSAYGRRWVG